MKPALVTKIPLVTLVGPPNSGKTTLFNYLSGQNFKTANYPGATVEYSVGRFQTKFGFSANLLDSPGIVSLTPSSPDEKVSVEALYAHPILGTPDVIIVTVDASQLSRHLLLARQLIESKFTVIIALTMVDLLKKRGLELSVDGLEKELGCKIISVDGRTGAGINLLLKAVEQSVAQSDFKLEPLPYCCDLEMDRLIHSYGEIEIIEQNVLSAIKPYGLPNINLQKAQKELAILNQPVVKKLRSHLPDNTTLKIDRYLLHKYWGLFFFFLIMAVTFTSIFWLAAPFMDWIDKLFGYLSTTTLSTFGFTWYGDLMANGIISGTGSVLVFVPQIIILFLILGILEDTGYLARGAMLIDKPLSKIGLNGKSFVPMLSGFACAIPAMLASRTIPNRRERLLTIFIIPLMSCSARLPVYALLLAFLIPTDKLWLGGIALATIYIFSIISSVVIAGIANKFKNKIVKEEDNSSFILELPAYRKPQVKVVLINTYHSAKIYLKKAGPIIVGFSIILWFLTYFPNVNPTVD
ncbi:MAG: ferrous iron transport protein B, partial [Ignavibacteriaceae bacterium]|nr:ferrous iron transport protein B [Ignavibacteriaceae bacterium]